MKTTKFISLVFVVTATIFLSFSFITTIGGSVKGKVSPTDGAYKVCAISGIDSFRSNILNGSFQIKDLRPGTYQVLIESTAPYKNALRTGIKIAEGEITDIGEIKLEK